MEITRFERVFDVHGYDDERRLVQSLDIVAVSKAEAEAIMMNADFTSGKIVEVEAFETGGNYVIVRRIIASD